MGGVNDFILVDLLWGHWDFSLSSIYQDFYEMLSLLFELTAVLFSTVGDVREAQLDM